MTEYENQCRCGFLSTCDKAGDWRQCKYGQIGRMESHVCAFYLAECNHCRHLKAQKDARETEPQ